MFVSKKVAYKQVVYEYYVSVTSREFNIATRHDHCNISLIFFYQFLTYPDICFISGTGSILELINVPGFDLKI